MYCIIRNSSHFGEYFNYYLFCCFNTVLILFFIISIVNFQTYVSKFLSFCKRFSISASLSHPTPCCYSCIWVLRIAYRTFAHASSTRNQFILLTRPAPLCQLYICLLVRTFTWVPVVHVLISIFVLPTLLFYRNNYLIVSIIVWYFILLYSCADIMFLAVTNV